MMKRDYRNEKQLADVVYFIGTEVEKTPFYGEKTLFVVGFRNPKKVALRAKENTCRHIYLGANMCFRNTKWDDSKYMKLREIIDYLLDQSYKVTLDISRDFKLDELEQFKDNEYFHIMYSLPIANAEDYANRITIKIDDVDFNSTNTGVWCNNLNKMMDNIVKTEWSAYSTDEVLE